ncbi:MAG: sigma-70 family RNA polymerase sigma factor [Bacillota bacterium]|nr:sigma-70 family RNA polymerase sigma factor [Bacillota bacterium]
MVTEREQAFFISLCQENYERIFKYLVVRIHDHSVAEDIIQSVFLAAWEKISYLPEHPNPVGFLYITARNQAASYLRQQKKRPLPLEEREAPATVGDLDRELEVMRDRAIDEGSYVEKILSTLSPESAKLYCKFYREGREVKEIAAEEGVSPTAIRMRLLRLRQRVKAEAAKIFEG